MRAVRWTGCEVRFEVRQYRKFLEPIRTRSNLFELENLLPKSGIDFVRSDTTWVNLELFVIHEILVTPFRERRNFVQTSIRTSKITGQTLL